MKNRIFVLFLISWLLVGCNSSLSLVHLNNKFIKEEKPLSDWDKDLLKTRTKAFEKLNVNLNSANAIYLIEEYDVEDTDYYGLLYLGENQYYHFCRKNFSKEIDILNRGLSNTEKFIIEELKKEQYDNIKEKSINTDVISSGSLYVTVVQNKAKKRIKFFRLQEFYID
ncbi:MAG: hypothetical protein ACEPOV_14830 [Hyphomicrobiales bacterium]